MNLIKRATVWLLAVVTVLGMIPQTVFAKEKAESSLAYEIEQKVNKEKTEATISLKFTETEAIQLEKVTLPDGTEKTEDLAVITHVVSENGKYEFKADYFLDGAEKEETITVEVTELEEKDNITSVENNSNLLQADGNTYEVSTAEELTTAIGQIESSQETEVTIVLKKDIARTLKFAGVAGKHITLKSKEGQNYSIELAKEIVGDLTLDNIRIYNGKNYYIYANGHRFETTANFYSTSSEKDFSILYGGGSPGNDVTGGTNLILRGNVRFGRVYDGGHDSNVTGDTHILIDDKRTQGSVHGGGHAENTQNGKVFGNTNYSPKDFENGDATYNAGIGSLNGCGYKDVVRGTVSIYVGKGAYVSGIYAAGGMSQAVDGAGSGANAVEVSNVNNEEYAVHVIYENDEVYDNVNKNKYHSLTIGSYNEDGAVSSTVNGDVLVEMRSGYFDSIIIDGGDEDWQRGLSLNGNSEIIVTGGRVRDIIGDARHWNNKGYTDSVTFKGCKQCEVGQMKVMGNIRMIEAAELLVDYSKFYEQSDKVPFVNCDNLSITEGSRLTTRDAETQLKENVDMQNGTWNAKGKLWVYEKMTSADSHILFEKDYSIGHNHVYDSAITDFACFDSQNDTFVSLNPAKGTYGNFVGNVTLNNSDMTFMCPTDVWGNWKGGNSVIKVPAVTKNYDGTENGADIALNIQNVVSEAATITMVDPDNYQELKEPQLGDNYVVGLKAEGDNPIESTFILGNESALGKGYYLKRVND